MMTGSFGLSPPGIGMRPGFMPARPPMTLLHPPAAPPPPRMFSRLTPQQLKREDELRRIRAGAMPPVTSSWWTTQQMQQRNLIQQREFNRLLRENTMLTREQAALRAQAIANQQVPASALPPSAPPITVPTAPSAQTDLGPTQNAAAESSAESAPPEMPHAKKSHMLIFVGLAAAAGVGGYVLIKKRKKS